MSHKCAGSRSSTITVGFDPGDGFSHYSEIDLDTGVIAEDRLRTTDEVIGASSLAAHPYASSWRSAPLPLGKSILTRQTRSLP
jgi:hypothetical protein